MRALPLVLVVACRPSWDEEGGTPPRTSGPEETGETGRPDETGTGTDSDTDYGVFDCATIPEHVEHVQQVQGAYAYNGLAIGEDGMLVGSDGWSLWKVDRGGKGGVFVPNIGLVYQMAYLPDGDLVVASSNQGALLRIAPNGASEPLADLSGVYGVTVGPLGRVYACRPNGVYRVDPDTGEAVRWVASQGYTPRVMDFDRDLSRAFIGTLDGQGRVFAVALDEDLEPLGEPEVLVDGVGGWHDGLRVDACGNIYVADYNRNNLNRITRDLQVHTAYDYGFSQYGHGIVWGTGADGWDLMAIYVPQPYNGSRVLEVIVGAPPRTWPGTVIND